MIFEFLAGAAALIVVVLLAVALIPATTHRLVAAPRPAASYEEAIERFEAIQAAEDAVCNLESRSRLLTHGHRTERVYVFVHGTTNSPRQFEEFGRLLKQRGHNVLILLKPCHGLLSYRVSELRRLRAEDLRAYADTAIDIAAGLGDEIVVCGISGGGAVAAWIAQNRPEVARALLLAPYLSVHGAPRPVSSLMVNFFSRVPSVTLEDPLEPRRNWVYRGQTTRGLAETLRLARAVLQRAPDTPPAAREMILLTTAADIQVNNATTAWLADQWRRHGAQVTEFEFERDLAVPHNAVDPSADPAKRQIVYERMLALLDEAPLTDREPVAPRQTA